MILSSPLVPKPTITPSLTHRLLPATSPTLTGSFHRCSTPAVITSARASISVAMSTEEEAEAETAETKIGARIRVTETVKVYHVQKAPEIDLAGMEGKIKQYVGVWKGKRISANFQFKVEFVADVKGRGEVKFVAHLKEDEFEYID